MAVRPSRVSPSVIAADRSTLLALQGMSDYQPLNSAYSLAVILQHEANLTQAQQALIRAEEALALARRTQIEMADVFHNAILGAKEQVIAQYGSDAPAVQIVGLTRKSDRRRPSKRKVAA